MPRNINVQAKAAEACARMTEPNVTALIGTLEKRPFYYVTMLLLIVIQIALSVIAIVGIVCKIETIISPIMGLTCAATSVILTAAGFFVGNKAFKAVASLWKPD